MPRAESGFRPRRLLRRLAMRSLQVLAVLVSLAGFERLRPVGRGLGSLQYRFGRRARQRVRDRMDRYLPGLEPGVLATSYRENTRAVLEVLALYSRRQPDRVIRKATRLEGESALEGLETGAILLGAHQGNGVLLPIRLAVEGYPVAVAIRESGKIPEGFFSRGLGRYGIRALDAGDGNRGLKGMIRALREGYLLYILIDQGSKHGGVEVEFLGRSMALPAGPAVLARRCRVPVIPAAVTGADPQWQFHLGVPERLPPREGPETEQQDVQRLARISEAQIRAHPELWTWHHRRWSRKY